MVFVLDAQEGVAFIVELHPRLDRAGTQIGDKGFDPQRPADTRRIDKTVARKILNRAGQIVEHIGEGIEFGIEIAERKIDPRGRADAKLAFSLDPPHRGRSGIAGDVFDYIIVPGFHLCQLQIFVIIIESRQAQPQPVAQGIGLGAHFIGRDRFGIVDGLACAAVEPARLVAGADAGIEQRIIVERVIERGAPRYLVPIGTLILDDRLQRRRAIGVKAADHLRAVGLVLVVAGIARAHCQIELIRQRHGGLAEQGPGLVLLVIVDEIEIEPAEGPERRGNLDVEDAVDRFVEVKTAEHPVDRIVAIRCQPQFMGIG